MQIMDDSSTHESLATRRNFMPKLYTAKLAVAVAALILSACAAIIRPNFETEIIKLRPGNYELDPRHSFVHFKVSHLGLSTYVGRFNTFDAQMDFNPDELTATRLEGTVEMNSVDTGDEEVDELLKEEAWFDTTRFPQAAFATDTVAAIDNGGLSIDGSLTLRGVTLPITLEGRFNGGADNLLSGRYTIGFSATGTFSRSAFGMDSFAGLIGDEVGLEVFAEFLKN